MLTWDLSRCGTVSSHEVLSNCETVSSHEALSGFVMRHCQVLRFCQVARLCQVMRFRQIVRPCQVMRHCQVLRICHDVRHCQVLRICQVLSWTPQLFFLALWRVQHFSTMFDVGVCVCGCIWVVHGSFFLLFFRSCFRCSFGCVTGGLVSRFVVSISFRFAVGFAFAFVMFGRILWLLMLPDSFPKFGLWAVFATFICFVVACVDWWFGIAWWMSLAVKDGLP